MNLLHLTNFNYRPFFITLLFGVFIYFIIQLVHRFLIMAVKSEKLRTKILKVLPVTERVTWSCYFILLVLSIVKANPIWGTLLVFGIMVAMWSFVRNYMTGLIMLLSKEYNIGQHIRINTFEGKIQKLNFLHCTILLTNGETLVLPYNQLIGSEVVKTSTAENVVSETLELHFSKPCNLHSKLQDLEQQLIAVPWLINREESTINVKAETATAYILSMKLNVLDQSHLYLVKNSLQLD